MKENLLLKADWNVKVHHIHDGLIYEETKENIVVRLARVDLLKHVFNLGSPINTGFLYMGAGSGSTAAAVTQSALVTELTGNANRITVTNTAGAALSASDIVQETSSSYDQKIIVQAAYPTGDGNNGSTFYEFGLFSSATFAAGTMWNRFVLGASIAKTNLIAITLQVSIRV